MPFVYTWFLPGSPWNPVLFSYLGLGALDTAATFDLCVTQQSLAGAVTHGFQLSWLHHCAQEFSSYRLVKYSRAGCLHPLEEWAQNQASPCLATPGCSFQPLEVGSLCSSPVASMCPGSEAPRISLGQSLPLTL